MNKLQNIVNNKWFPIIFFTLAIFISVFQHYRVFSLDVIGYHSWRQTQTQTVIDNFAKVDFNILNPRLNDLHYSDGIFRMEFPLAQWLVAGLYKLFGNHLFITRLFFYLITFLSVLGIFKLILSLTSSRLISLLTAWFFLFSPVIYYYSVNPLPDNLALCFGIWSVYFWINHLKQNQNHQFILSCILFALSVAVKLPFIVFGGMYLSKFYTKDSAVKFKYILVPFLTCLPALLWYLYVIGGWKGNGVVKGILGNDKTLGELFDILQFNLLSTLPELLLNYATFPLFIIGIYYTYKGFNFKNNIHTSFFYIGILCIIYFLYEMHLIARVHDYYLFPFLPLLFVLVAKMLYDVFKKINSSLLYLVLLSFILCPLTAYLRCNTRWNNQSPGFTKEYLFDKKELQKRIPDSAKIIVIGDDSRSIVLYHLQRKGWSYGDYGIKETDIENCLKNGALYLVTDCNLDTINAVNNHIDSLLFQHNKIKLYTTK